MMTAPELFSSVMSSVASADVSAMIEVMTSASPQGEVWMSAPDMRSRPREANGASETTRCPRVRAALRSRR